MFTLANQAMYGGETVYVTSSSTKLSVPASVPVPAGATSGSFVVIALTGYAGPVTVTAKAGGTRSYSATISSANVRTKPGKGGSPITSAPQALSCAPKLVPAGGTATCELQLSAATNGAAEVSLSASASVQVPARVRARPRQSALSFQVAIDPAAPTQTVAIQAALAGDREGDAVIEEHLSIVASRAMGSR